jgi:hypothetical protein
VGYILSDFGNILVIFATSGHTAKKISKSMNPSTTPKVKLMNTVLGNFHSFSAEMRAFLKIHFIKNFCKISCICSQNCSFFSYIFGETISEIVVFKKLPPYALAGFDLTTRCSKFPSPRWQALTIPLHT